MVNTGHERGQDQSDLPAVIRHANPTAEPFADEIRGQQHHQHAGDHEQRLVIPIDGRRRSRLGEEKVKHCQGSGVGSRVGFSPRGKISDWHGLEPTLSWSSAFTLRGTRTSGSPAKA